MHGASVHEVNFAVWVRPGVFNEPRNDGGVDFNCLRLAITLKPASHYACKVCYSGVSILRISAYT
jgi:hypothetical protein